MSSGVQFSNQWKPPSEEPETSKFALFVVKHSGGLIKDTTQANYFLLGVVVAGFTIIAVLSFGKKKLVETHVPLGDDEYLPVEYR